MECGISIYVATIPLFDGIHGGHRFRQNSVRARSGKSEIILIRSTIQASCVSWGHSLIVVVRRCPPASSSPVWYF